jgi:streptogramin lyase
MKMENKHSVFGNGVLKKSARELAVFVDDDGNTWICDKDAVSQIDRTKPFADQKIERCQVMPFDHGG